MLYFEKFFAYNAKTENFEIKALSTQAKVIGEMCPSLHGNRVF